MEPTDAPRTVEDLVFECLERLETEGDGVLDELAAAHPEHAAELRERMRLLWRVGLRPRAGANSAASVPERLGEFRLLERLGSGGMGVVYLAEQTSLGRVVALKLIRPEQLYFGHARERFEREIRAIARLHHPSIVPIHATGEENGIPYYAMERVRGASLARVIEAFAGRSPSELTGADLREVVMSAAPGDFDPAGDLFVGRWRDVAVRIATSLAHAVQHAHERGVLHRDVKPSNVMISVDGRVILLDFGLASLSSEAQLTRTGSQIGSIPYMAPEQLRGRVEDVGARTDVYAIGVVLFEMLALRPAFEDPGDTQVLRTRILEAPRQDVRQHDRGVSADLALVCATAMNVEPAARYASAALLAADLENVAALRPIAARAPGPLARARSFARRHPARATALLALTLVAVGGPLVFGLQQRTANRRIQDANTQLSLSLAESERQRVRADRERAFADRRLRDALESVDLMLTRVATDKLRDTPQMMTKRRELLEDALRFYARFLEEREGDPMLREAVELARLRVTSLHMTLGELETAQTELQGLVRELEPRVAITDVGDDLLVTYATVQGRLGEVLLHKNAYDDAQKSLLAAIAALERIPASRHGVDVVKQLGAAHDRVANLLMRRGKAAEAAAAARSAVAISRAARARFPDDEKIWIAFGRQLDRLGNALLRSGRTEESLVHAREAVEVLEDFRARHPRDVDGRQKLMAALVNLSSGLTAAQLEEEATAASRRAVEIGEALVREFPDAPLHRTDTALGHLQLLVSDYRRGALEEAETHGLRALALQESAVEAGVGDTTLEMQMASTSSNLAVLQLSLGRRAESLATTERGLAHVTRALDSSKRHPAVLETRRQLLFNRGRSLVALERWRDAEACASELEMGEGPDWLVRRAQLLERSARIAAVDPTVAPEERARESRRLCERALDDLRVAVERGHADWTELPDPEEWKLLRGDPRFEALTKSATQPAHEPAVAPERAPR